MRRANEVAPGPAALAGRAAVPSATALAEEILPALLDDEEMGFAVRVAVAAERARIAEELRDFLSTSLLAVAMGAASALSLEPSRDPYSLDQRLRELAQRAREAVAGVQRAIDDLREEALADTLTTIATAWGIAAQVSVTVHVSPGAQATGEMRDEFAEMLREALRNVGQHARASLVQISLSVEGERLILRVTDDGVGFFPTADLQQTQPGAGRGLARLAQHAGRLGGSLNVRSRPGGGTYLVVRAPLPAIADQASLTAPPTPTVRIAIADRDPVVRSGLRAVLEQVPGVATVAEGADAAEVAEQVWRHRADLLLLNIRAPQVAGTEAVLDAVRGKLFPPAKDASARTNHEDGPDGSHPGHSLTPRESEILRLIADGLSNRQIANRLVISPKTVKNHVSNIYHGIGVSDRSQAISAWRGLRLPGGFTA
jgi:DNA-binding NarL/FixJ family response regulator/two-component sensor histidine kinase